MDPRPRQPLHKQLASVLETEQKSKNLLESDILELKSSAENIMAWWHTRDPLFETGQSMVPSNSPQQFGNYIEKLTKLRICGALTLLVEIAHRDSTREEPKWASKILQNAGTHEPSSFFDSFLAISRLAIEQINKKKEEKELLGVRELAQLLTVAQLLMLNPKFSGSEAEREEFLKQVRFTLARVQDIIAGFCKTEEYENITTEELTTMDNIRILGLKGSLLINAWAEKSQTPEEQKLGLIAVTKREALLRLLEDIRSMFCDPENKSNTIWKRLKSRHIKGPLHEILWYLDIIMLKHMYPQKYDSIFIKPAHSYADRPTIGKPENNRAYDYYMFYRSKKKRGAIKDFVQLKSSPQREGKPGRDNKHYHPLIHVLEEQNFMEVNPDRLRVKINLYKQIVERGFKASDAEKFDNYVLPTAKKHLEDFARGHGLK